MAPQAAEELKEKFGDDVRVLAVAPNVDERGRLLELDFSTVPFPVRRVFAIAGVPPGTFRGGHRHQETQQLLTCVAGRVEVELRRGQAHHELVLTPDSGSLHIAPGVWARQRYVTDGTVLLVLASEPFDPASYDGEH